MKSTQAVFIFVLSLLSLTAALDFPSDPSALTSPATSPAPENHLQKRYYNLSSFLCRFVYGYSINSQGYCVDIDNDTDKSVQH